MAPESGVNFAVYSSSKGNYFFHEIRDLIGTGLAELGYRVKLCDDSCGFFPVADWHIVIAPHEFFYLGHGVQLGKLLLPTNLVLFNTEQPSTEWFSRALAFFQYAHTIWDIEYGSSLRINSKGDFEAHYLPLGFSSNYVPFQNISRIPVHAGTDWLPKDIIENPFIDTPFVDRPIDILFIGTATGRRDRFFKFVQPIFSKYRTYIHCPEASTPILANLNTCMNTETVVGLAQRSKILINLHRGDDIYFEWHRIVMHGILQKVLVVSEICSPAPPISPNLDFVSVPIDTIAHQVEYFLSSKQGNADAQQIIDRGFNTVTQKCRLIDALKPLVDKLNRNHNNSINASACNNKTPLLESVRSVCFVTKARNGKTWDSTIVKYNNFALALLSMGFRVTVVVVGDKDVNYNLEEEIGFGRLPGIDYILLPRVPKLDHEYAHPTIEKSYSIYQFLKHNQFDDIHFPDTGGLAYYSINGKKQGNALQSSKICVHILMPVFMKLKEKGMFLDSIEDIESNFMEQNVFSYADIIFYSDFAIINYVNNNWSRFSVPYFIEYEIVPNLKTRQSIAASFMNSSLSFDTLSTKQPLVSVCLVHFNRPEYLKLALDSLYQQDYKNYEVILVDDGSTKRDAIEYLSSLEPDFTQRGWKIIRQQNAYLGAARNTAARNAKGEYLLFMDDDNIAKPHEISTFVQIALKTEADICTCVMDLFSGNGTPTSEELSSKQVRWLFIGGCLSAGLFYNCYGDANALIKRSVFESVGGFTEDYGVTHEDWEFFSKAVAAGFHIEVVTEPLFWYRRNQGSMIGSTNNYKNMERSTRPYLGIVPKGTHELVNYALGLHLQKLDLANKYTLASSNADVFKNLLPVFESCASAAVYLEYGEINKANVHLEAAITKANKSGNQLVIYYTCHQIADTLSKSGHNERAVKYLEMALRVAFNSNDIGGINDARSKLAVLSGHSR